MKRMLMSLAVSAVMVPTVAFACDGELKAESGVKTTTVAEVAKNTKVKMVDANNADFRTQNGTVPGAVLLTSAGSYDPAKELPAAKNAELVFYCASKMCGASHMAAERASKAGYTNVSVMSEGLLGWKAAGRKTAPPKPST
jgi:rhodanese-related sulfurtransferase